MKKKIVLILFILTAVLSFAQETLTPDQYFEKVSGVFSTIYDYQADIEIYRGDSLSMKGIIYYKKPNKIKIEFEMPNREIFVTNGREMFWYIPSLSYVLKQNFTGSQLTQGSAEGLNHLKNHYSIGYVDSPNPVALDTDHTEKVIKLKFVGSSSGFQELEISFTLSGLIRQIRGNTYGSYMTINYWNIKTNIGLADNMFDYDPPEDATIFENFLYEVVE